jgi:microcystin degradation protein MlrC
MPTKKRVALMGFLLESNSFAPVSDEQAFRSLCYMAGDEILEDIAKPNASLPVEIPSFCAAMDQSELDWQPMPIVVTAAEPGGPVDQAFFKRTQDDMEQRLCAAMPLDGVYIAEHGAMTGTDSPDPDGDLFEMVRGIVGPDVPILATLDLHANISEKMVDNTDVLISYLTNPHVDQKERAEEACGLMIEMWNGMRPKTAFIRLPLVAPSVTLLTAVGPYADMINAGQAKKTDAIANVSVVAGFVFGDTPMNGIAVVVAGRNDLTPARQLCTELAQQGWDDRDRFKTNLTSLDDAVAMMAENGKDSSRPAQIFADVADNPGGGGRGNTTWILQKLVESGADGVYFSNFIDPALAARAHDAGVGASFDAVFNDNSESLYSNRFESPVRVLGLCDGRCIGRRGIWAGRALNLGPSALLEVGGVKVVVGSLRKQGADPVWLEMFGLDVADARSVVVKSRGHFRAGYDEYFSADRTFEIDVPGLTSPVLDNFEFKGLPRPVYGLDKNTKWEGPDWR